LRQFLSPPPGILGSAGSPPAALVEVALDASVKREADFVNVAHTAGDRSG